MVYKRLNDDNKMKIWTINKSVVVNSPFYYIKMFKHVINMLDDE